MFFKDGMVATTVVGAVPKREIVERLAGSRARSNEPAGRPRPGRPQSFHHAANRSPFFQSARTGRRSAAPGR